MARVKKWRGQKTKKSTAGEWHIYKKILYIRRF
jgi:hypothetical protein